jgi:hypothetical protein
MGRYSTGTWEAIVLDLMVLEADKPPDLDDRDAPFGHQPPHVALARAQAERNVGHRD